MTATRTPCYRSRTWWRDSEISDVGPEGWGQTGLHTSLVAKIVVQIIWQPIPLIHATCCVPCLGRSIFEQRRTGVRRVPMLGAGGGFGDATMPLMSTMIEDGYALPNHRGRYLRMCFPSKRSFVACSAFSPFCVDLFRRVPWAAAAADVQQCGRNGSRLGPDRGCGRGWLGSTKEERQCALARLRGLRRPRRETVLEEEWLSKAMMKPAGGDVGELRRLR